MRLEHHLVGGYVRYISPHIIIIIILTLNYKAFSKLHISNKAMLYILLPVSWNSSNNTPPVQKTIF